MLESFDLNPEPTLNLGSKLPTDLVKKEWPSNINLKTKENEGVYKVSALNEFKKSKFSFVHGRKKKFTSLRRKSDKFQEKSSSGTSSVFMVNIDFFLN